MHTGFHLTFGFFRINYDFPPDARLHDASMAGQINSQAWALGAALLRESAIEPQQRLKVGLLFELKANRVHALASEDAELHELITRLYRAVEAIPVTGRTVAQLDPLQQLILSNNALLESGDRLFYPRKAEQVRVTGAVIYLPAQAKRLSPATRGLNSDMATFLATQYQLGGRFSE